ncbi:MAG TPA: sterol desaturase family protein [Candidatus Babeliales bacterium]|nr:sterol desaturase family protein [Candidatus Babeliales bacterium]
MPTTHFAHIQFIFGITLTISYFTFFLMEQKWPLRKRTRSLVSRIRINFTFTIIVYITAALLISPLEKFIIEMTTIHQFGLLPWLSITGTYHFILGFLLMDLTFYYWHRMNHEINLLWRFHNVHHVDPDLDVTTSMRFHIIEIAYSSIFRLVQLSLIGIDPLVFFCYEFVFQLNTFFQHSNIKLPIRLERILNKFIVTPRMHGIHHSIYFDEVNRNYSIVFSIWDHLHKTIKLNIPQQSITIGVPSYLGLSDNTFVNLLLMPFKSQRRYWRVNNKSYLNRHFESADIPGRLVE